MSDADWDDEIEEEQSRDDASVIDRRGMPIWSLYPARQEGELRFRDRLGSIMPKELFHKLLPMLVKYYENVSTEAIAEVNRRVDERWLNEQRAASSSPKTLKPKVTSGYVYLLFCKARDLYKIGMTTTPVEIRLRTIAAEIGADVALVAAKETEDPRATERLWHNRFWKKHRGREWFELTREDVELFCAPEGPVTP